MTTTIVGHILAYAVITGTGSVVHRTAVRQIDTAAFRRRGVVVNHGRRGKRRIAADNRTALRLRIFLRDMRYHQTATATRSAVRDMAVTYLTFIIHAYTAAITLEHTDTGSLTGMDIAELNHTAAVAVDTAASHRSQTGIHRTSAHIRVAHHIHTAAVRRVLTGLHILRGCRTARNHTAVYRCRMLQRSIVTRRAVIHARAIEFAVRSEPYYVVRARGEHRIIASADGVIDESRRRRSVVTRQNSLVCQIPLRRDRVRRYGTVTLRVGPVLRYFLTILHDTVTRLLLRRIRIKTAIHMNTGRYLKRCIE